MKQSIAFADWRRAQVLHIEQVLEQVLLPLASPAQRLKEAMCYAVLGGGKRIRAALVFAAGHACTITGHELATKACLDQAAAAVEIIHAYSLIHDDLPCMDNDDLRRGRATTHKQFDEATALLAGDALQPLAFELLANMNIAPVLVVQAIQVLTQACGCKGMAGGQAIDLQSVGHVLTLSALQNMHTMKTGAMLQASVALGGIVAGASSSTRQILSEYAKVIGLAFQIIDDILDLTTHTDKLGKTAGKDAINGKPTYVSLLGLDQARNFVQELHQAAHQALVPLGEQGARLAELADFIVVRDC